MGRIIPYIVNNKNCLKPPTSSKMAHCWWVEAMSKVYPISWTQFAQSQKANLGRSVKLLCHTFFTHLAYPVMELRQNTEFIHPSSSASELNKRAAGAKPENSVGPASYAGFPSGNIWKATPKKMPTSETRIAIQDSIYYSIPWFFWVVLYHHHPPLVVDSIMKNPSISHGKYHGAPWLT